MAWRLARSLETLRAQINELSPNRSRVSDGTIGNAEHAARSSDHNPWVKDGKTGIVTAIDITNDPAHGIDSEKLAEALLHSRDPRIKYIISNRKIAAGADGPAPWTWRKYGGSNPHNHHVHISVEERKDLYDRTTPWIFALPMPGGSATLPPKPPVHPVLSNGDNGPAVMELQRSLNSAGAHINVDGFFGGATDRALRLFQRTHGLEPDGVAGPYTWDALKAV